MTDMVTCPVCESRWDRLTIAMCRKDGTDLWSIPDHSATQDRSGPEPGSESRRGVTFAIGGTSFTLAEGDDPLLLGRDEAAVTGDALISHANVSRVHAVIEFIDGELRITDAGSTNGTFIDGAELEEGVPRVVVPGQRVRLASDVEIQINWEVSI